MKLVQSSAALLLSSMSTMSLADTSNGVSIKAGALGAGIEYYHGISNNINVRIGMNAFNYDDEIAESRINYDMTLELRTASIIMDYHPFDSSGFRVSAGAFYNGNKASLEALSVNGEYEFNGDVYRVEDIGTANGDVEFKKFAPYLGVGWAFSPTSTSTWTFNLEAGAFYQDTPEAQLNVSCGTALPTMQCEQLLVDVRAEQKQLEQDIKEYKWYPVIMVGLQYKF